jgi:hypothetical protein
MKSRNLAVNPEPGEEEESRGIGHESFGSTAAALSQTPMEDANSATDFALSLLRGFRNGRSNKAEVGSNGSNGGSDTNSGLVSFSNNSFLFQFDGEEGALTNGSFPSSESDNKIGGSDSDGDGRDSRSSQDGRADSATNEPGDAEISKPDSALASTKGPGATSHTPNGMDEMARRTTAVSSLTGASASTSTKKAMSHTTKSSISSITMSSMTDSAKIATTSKTNMPMSTARDGHGARSSAQPQPESNTKSITASYYTDAHAKNGTCIRFITSFLHVTFLNS